jgi:uncharacterized membrane protein YagU involved in acid resistance
MMEHTSLLTGAAWRQSARAVLAGGILAGLGDMTQALIVFGQRGVPPIRVLQSIAVGVAGRAAFDGGWRMALLGLVLHFLIATIWAAIYLRVSGTLRLLVEHPILCGLLYGIVVFLIMYEVVLPMSRVARDPLATLFTAPLIITGWIGHPLLVGLPIALATRRFVSRPASERS